MMMINCSLLLSTITFTIDNEFQPFQPLTCIYRIVQGFRFLCYNISAYSFIQFAPFPMVNHYYYHHYYHYTRMEEHPCFGATTGLTPEQWWYEVIKQTYLTTERLVNIDPEEINQLMPAVFQFLFYEIFNTKKGWSVKEDALYTLEKLRDWRDQGAGPKLGVISNFDNRLPAILEG